MARPTKDHADWFRHDADASSDEKLLYIESLFGLKGYAFYFKMLEILTRTDGFEIELSTLKTPIYAKKIGVSVDEFKEMIDATTIPELEIFVLTDDNFLYSSGLKKRLEPLLSKRERDRSRAQEVSGDENGVFAGENSKIADEKYTENRREQKSREEKSREQKRTEEQSEIFDGENSVDLSFENLFTVLLSLLSKYDKSDHPKAAEQRRLKAESLFQRYDPEYISEKMVHFRWIMRYKPELAGRSPTGYFINSVEKRWAPPAGYEEWREDDLRSRRKREEQPVDDEEYSEFVKTQIKQSLGR